MLNYIFVIVLLTLLFKSSFALSFEIPHELSKLEHSLRPVNHRHDVVISTDRDKTINDHIHRQYKKWQGTRYQFGGNTPNGIDCSALMQHFYKNILKSPLPRTTKDQIKHGVAINKDSLKTGDLIFFRTGFNERHVGVYIGGNKFIHASRSTGVRISSLNQGYWQMRFMTARRVIE